jgi:hypothetical protein
MNTTLNHAPNLAQHPPRSPRVRLGGLLEKMPATQFWLLHAALSGTAGIIFLVADRLFGHLLAPGESESGSRVEP